MYRRALLVAIAVVLSFSALVGIFPQTASADSSIPSPYLAQPVLTAAKLSTERNTLAMCVSMNNGYAFKNSGGGYDIKPSDIASGAWFSNATTVRQWSDYNNGDNGTDCDHINPVPILQDLGFTGGNIVSACALGLARQDKSDCVNGTGDMYYNGGSKQDVLNRIDKIYAGTTFGKDYTAEQYYVMAMSVALSSKACNATPLALAATATPDQKNTANTDTLTVVGSDGVSTAVLYQFKGNTGTSWSFRNAVGNGTYYVNETCDQLKGVINENANAYAAWVRANQPGSAGNPGTCEQYATLQVGGAGPAAGAQKTTYNTLLTDCNDGLNNKTTPNYCDKYKPKPIPHAPVSDQTDPEYAACLYGYGTATATAPTSGTTDSPTASDKPTCGIQGIGWLVCPVMSFMAKITDAAYNFLASYFLSIDTSLVTQSQTSWARFRDIANVAFVIALLFVVYSQVTSFGISNYGVKRMLPRIIVAALLVNISFYICAGAVDLSNLLGYAIPQFFGNIPIGAGISDSGGAAALGNGLSWVTAIGAIIVVAVGVALAISVPVLIAALLAIGLIVLMLVARQALVVLLIVISPLAFVAYLLPNTEQWFKKWYKAFFTLLMLFPVIGTVFGASRMAALIINNAGGSAGTTITQLIALAVSAIPFFVVPGLLKGSLAAAGTIGAKMQGMANKATGKVGSHAKNSSRLGAGLADMRKYRESQRAIKFAKGRGTGIMAGVGVAVGGRGYNRRAQSRANQLELEEHESDVKAAGSDMAANMSYEAILATAQDGTADAIHREAAVKYMMDNGNFTERQKVLRSAGNMTDSQRKTAVRGALAKGDGGVYGSSTLGTLMDAERGTTDGDAILNNTGQHLDNGTVKRINSKEVSPETFNRDSYTSGYIEGQVGRATPEGQNALAQSLSDYAATDQGKKATAATQADAQKVINAAPTAPTAPSSNQQAAATGQTSSPSTLTIPHSGGGSTPPPPGAPGAGFVQRPSGLFVPPGSSGGNPPPSNP